MREQTFSPGWYIGATPAGAFAVVKTGSHILTHGGVVPLPSGAAVVDCLVLDRTGTRIAGTVARGRQDFAVEWDWVRSEWVERGLSFGRFACAYGPDGSLYVCTSGTTGLRYLPGGGVVELALDCGPLGIRWVDDAGTVIFSHRTYADKARGLYEYTEWPDVAIGQGHDSIGEGAVVWAGGVLRRLAEGGIRDIKPQRDGNDFAIPYWKLDGTAAIIYATLDELWALPPVTVPVPPTPPIPPTPPTPEPTMQFTAHEQSILVAFDAAYPVPQGAGKSVDKWEAERRYWTMTLAQTFNARAGAKWGTKRADPNRPPSKDALAFEDAGRLWGFDTCVATSDTTVKINPNAHGEDITGQVFIPVEAKDWLAGDTPPTPPVDPPTPPVDPPTPPTPGTDYGPAILALVLRVNKLEAHLENLTKPFTR
jgi:hypothetical protein